MKLVTIERHPSHSGVFDKFIEGMKVDAEGRASIRQMWRPTVVFCSELLGRSGKRSRPCDRQKYRRLSHL
jgi:hypothetical protein